MSASTFPVSTAPSTPATSFDRYANGGWRGADRDPGRPVQHRLVPDRRPARRAAQRRHHRRRVAEQSGGRDERAPDRRLLCRLSRPRRDRSRAAQRRSSRISSASRRSRTAATSPPRSAPRMRADVDPLNATSFGTENLFGVFVAQGLQEPNRNFAYLLQGGLGLPDRDYYLSETPAMTRVRDAYRDLYRPDADPDGRARCGGPRRAHLRARDQDRPRPCRRGRRAGPAPGADLGAAPIRHPRARHRLGRLLRGGAPRRRGADRRLARRADPRHLRPRRQRAARRLEGLVRLPHRQPHDRGAAAGL